MTHMGSITSGILGALEEVAQAVIRDAGTSSLLLANHPSGESPVEGPKKEGPPQTLILYSRTAPR
jgi:hypothetical protein